MRFSRAPPFSCATFSRVRRGREERHEFLIVGAFAGALAALLMHEGGYGLASDMLVGIIGALLGALL